MHRYMTSSDQFEVVRTGSNPKRHPGSAGIPAGLAEKLQLSAANCTYLHKKILLQFCTSTSDLRPPADRKLQLVAPGFAKLQLKFLARTEIPGSFRFRSLAPGPLHGPLITDN